MCLGSISSPHYYYGRSVTRFLAHLTLTQMGFFKRRGLSKELKQELKGIRNSKTGKSALVIGGGPSLTDFCWDQVKDLVHEVIVVNNFHLSGLSNQIKPDYICLSDPNSFLPASGDRAQIFNSLWEFVSSSGATVIAPHFYRNFKFPEKTKAYFFDDREFFTLRKSISPLRPRSYSSMTFLKALAFCIFLGYKTIYIIGLDNSEFLSYEGDESNQLFINYKKFYGGRELNLIQEDKLKIDFFPDGLAGRLQSYAHLFGDLALFEDYNIVNLDRNSLITNFKKE